MSEIEGFVTGPWHPVIQAARAAGHFWDPASMRLLSRLLIILHEHDRRIGRR